MRACVYVCVCMCVCMSIVRGREKTREEGDRKRRRKIAGASSGRPPTEGNELGLVPGPATYIPARAGKWKRLFLHSFLYEQRSVCYVRNVSASPLGVLTVKAYGRTRNIASWSIARGRTFPFIGSFTHRPRRIPGDSRCPADRSHDNNFVPIVPCHSREVRPTVRGCLTPRVVAPPPWYRVVWPSAQSSPSTGKSRELHPW